MTAALLKLARLAWPLVKWVRLPRPRRVGLADAPRSQRALGHDVLGPIFFDFCDRLHQQFLAAPPRSAVLYMARAGLRLRYLYHAWCETQGRTPPLEERDFYASRLSVAKGCLANDFEYVLALVRQEYPLAWLGPLIRAVTCDDIELPWAWDHVPALDAHVRRAYAAPDAPGEAIRRYFREQADLLARYVRRLLGDATTALLVDSGWLGRTQALLLRAFPEITWKGLYFGRWDYGRGEPDWFAHVQGLSVSSSAYRPGEPATAVLHHHHLIEALLEVNIPSTRAYVVDSKTGEVTADVAPSSNACFGPGEQDTHFAGVVDYFREQQPQPVEKAAGQARAAYEVLERLILYPRPDEVPMLLVRDRSADFGKSAIGTVLRDPDNGPRSLEAKLGRIYQALWRPGQVALEFPRTAWLLQRWRRFPPAV